MNTVVTSREEILKNCRELVSEKGLSSLTMRIVARKCNVALGSLYNYFPSKNDLITVAIESVWQDIFHMERGCQIKNAFPDYIEWIFENVRAGMSDYPNFFTAHSIVFASGEKNNARETMERYLTHIEQGMQAVLDQDERIRKDAFDETFTQADFIDFIIANLVLLLTQHTSSCSVLQEMARRALYEKPPST